MYHVSAQGVDERMINVHYYYSDLRYTGSTGIEHSDLLYTGSAGVEHTYLHKFRWG